ncbi:unnamed protein product [Hermetia illucens]|uniref:Uncharacterized protein n=1 Tax=Hermetia illucens TaxID=343691 RepID=A0A7R8YW24_HERIL|nr:unnamed protein product [Hermetia illucens]
MEMKNRMKRFSAFMLHVQILTNLLKPVKVNHQGRLVEDFRLNEHRIRIQEIIGSLKNTNAEEIKKTKEVWGGGDGNYKKRMVEYKLQTRTKFSLEVTTECRNMSLNIIRVLWHGINLPNYNINTAF